jgi:release factor glutamine methyltransferase
MTVADALERAASILAAAGIVDARLDAELLLRHVTGWNTAALLVRAQDAVPDAVLQRFEPLVAERARRRPLQHLTGIAHFWRHEFLVTPDVLVPRPETEHLIEAALAWLGAVERPVVADVGTGSGCIALSIAYERPDAQVHAIDLSPAALRVARENADRLGLADRVRFHEGDLLAPLVDRLAPLGDRLGPLGAHPIDLVVSNPPYVGADEVETLAPEVRDHDPRMALVPPGDRESVYRRLAAQARERLRPGGALMVEIGQGMEPEVSRIVTAAGLVVERVVPDLQSIPRVVVAARPAR